MSMIVVIASAALAGALLGAGFGALLHAVLARLRRSPPADGPNMWCVCVGGVLGAILSAWLASRAIAGVIAQLV